MRFVLIIALEILCVSCGMGPGAERAEQSVRQTTVCEIVTIPGDFSHDTIKLRAGFEHTGAKTVVYDKRCPDDSIVWIEPANDADPSVFKLNKMIVDIGVTNAEKWSNDYSNYVTVEATVTALVSWDQAAPIGTEIEIKPIRVQDVTFSRGKAPLFYKPEEVH